MIERLGLCLRELSRLTPEALNAPGAQALRRDCADALRLELDCRQLELGPSARDVLERLSDLLEEASVRGAELSAAVRAARVVLGTHNDTDVTQ